MPIETYEIAFEAEQQGMRLDAALSVLLEDLSRSYIQKLIMAGQVELNGSVITVKKYAVHCGDKAAVHVPEPQSLDIRPENIALDIIYEDQDVLVVNKPKGMVVHPAAGNFSGTLVNAILYHCRDLSGINGVMRPGIVHRIDKDTSGLLMVAKNDRAHESLARQLKEHSIARVYHAVVYNNFKEDSGTVDAPIGRDPANRFKMAVTRTASRHAVTHYKVLERFGDFTHIEARLETGRTHQIRVHMAYIRHPLVGDPVYGPARRIPGVETQMLHAKTLGFIHPSTGQYMEFDSQLPEQFQKFFDWARKR